MEKRFAAKPNRFDPYKNFKFRVKLEGRAVAGISKVGALGHVVEIEARRKGGDRNASRKPPGRAKYDAITLERGITQDPEFERWARKAASHGLSHAKPSLANLRKNIIIEVRTEAGQIEATYKIHRCWVSEFQAIPDPDAGANAVVIEAIKLENEGWERVD